MFHGVYVPVVTPFHSDGSLDINSLSRLCERVINQGARGIVPLGTTGEASALDSGERSLVVETCAKAVAGTNVQLIIGAGTNSTATTISRMEEFYQSSPDAFLIVTPYYVRPSEEGILAHFTTVADVADQLNADVMLYNIPARSGRYVSAKGILTCASHKRIRGVKQAGGGLDDETISLLSQAPKDFSVLAGDDTYIAPMTLLGGKGAVAASAHLATPLWVELVDAAMGGDVERVRELHNMLVPLVSAAFSEPNPTVFKGVLAARGEIESDFVRLPLVAASASAVSNCIDVLNRISG